MHDDYYPDNTPKSHADIALLIMSQIVDFTDHIQPICLPSLSAEVENIAGVVAGYGRSKASDLSKEIAFFVNLKTIELIICYSLDPHSSRVVSPKSFCTKSDEITLCKGKFLLMINSILIIYFLKVILEVDFTLKMAENGQF